MPGAAELLQGLAARGVDLGIVTRNNLTCANITLAACGFDHHFDDEHILHRDTCAPKPAPDGVNHLLSLWQADPGNAVMVGDYPFDLQAGRGAGTATIYIDTSGSFPWRDDADVCVSSLHELTPVHTS